MLGLGDNAVFGALLEMGEKAIQQEFEKNGSAEASCLVLMGILLMYLKLILILFVIPL